MTGQPAAPAPAVTQLPAEIQVVQFFVPDGVKLEVLGPTPQPIPSMAGDADTLFGLKVGQAYRLKISNIPDRPGAELYPVLEVVGHLHRPVDVDAGRFPIRVAFGDVDFEEAVDRGRLITEVIYLEDPDQALPMHLPKGEIPVLPLNPAEDPVRVGAALGRPVVILHLGGRVPNPEEWTGSGDLGMGSTPCPFSNSGGGRCPLPCGPVRGTAPPAGRTWLPRDEYLCDGGDRGDPAHFGGDGGLEGIDPRDAVIRYQDDRRPRILPSNLVCLYAPRFAAVRTSIGPNEAVEVDVPHGTETVERQVMYERQEQPRKLVQNRSAEAARHRARPSSMVSRVLPGEFIELRVLQGFENMTHIAGFVRNQGPQSNRQFQQARTQGAVTGPLTIKTAEAPVVTGVIQSAGETVMSWKPQEIAGVELPPNRPGVSVLKQSSAGVAEPGDVVTFTIKYRNMGNVSITSVSVVDSLMPRLEYVPGSAIGPQGAVFSAADNRAGSTELRWDLPGALAPGAEGYVQFQARVR